MAVRKIWIPDGAQPSLYGLGAGAYIYGALLDSFGENLARLCGSLAAHVI